MYCLYAINEEVFILIVIELVKFRLRCHRRVVSEIKDQKQRHTCAQDVFGMAAQPLWGELPY